MRECVLSCVDVFVKIVMCWKVSVCWSICVCVCMLCMCVVFRALMCVVLLPSRGVPEEEWTEGVRMAGPGWTKRRRRRGGEDQKEGGEREREREREREGEREKEEEAHRPSPTTSQAGPGSPVPVPRGAGPQALGSPGPQRHFHRDRFGGGREGPRLPDVCPFQ